MAKVTAMYMWTQVYGHHVRLATHSNFRGFVKSAGVDFYPLGGDPRVLAGCKRSSTLIYFWKFLKFLYIVTVESFICNVRCHISYGSSLTLISYICYTLYTILSSLLFCIIVIHILLCFTSSALSRFTAFNS